MLRPVGNAAVYRAQLVENELDIAMKLDRFIAVTFLPIFPREQLTRVKPWGAGGLQNESSYSRIVAIERLVRGSSERLLRQHCEVISYCPPESATVPGSWPLLSLLQPTACHHSTP
ncbi:jg4801 [Pararge aegeria aegeria]|uniref:Jg4801 protein n=1 Tax=Pararge aegeria aegeria TaxID=348720 RepID=A0A8S4R2Y2_9NEOP|nr:jg4801 [Pararge aegeria aegeria]